MNIIQNIWWKLHVFIVTFFEIQQNIKNCLRKNKYMSYVTSDCQMLKNVELLKYSSFFFLYIRVLKLIKNFILHFEVFLRGETFLIDNYT